jgi:starch synthase
VRVLFAAAEVYPLVKTGGLADVAAALPAALLAQGISMRVIMPAYRGVAGQLPDLVTIGSVAVRGQSLRVIEGRHPDSGVPLLLLDAPFLFDRGGNPYLDAHGFPHSDNALRFATFCEAVAQIACGALGREQAADIVHLNDWHTGLVPACLAERTARPRTLLTIHNLAYQGIYDRAQFTALGLPESLWHPGAAEFHGDFCFLKAGLQLADLLTTVSPTYAREIQTPEFGERLDGVLRERASLLTGILNGIDDVVWNPATDPLIEQCYDATTVVAGKSANKRALQRELGLDAGDDPLLAFIGRLAYQKGADALLAARADLDRLPLQLVILASGDRGLEQGFAEWASSRPGRVATSTAHDERLAHRIEAGADMLIMPSRFEPCGLNQMYSQRYGTIPLVRRVGGLADSVDDLGSARGTGIHFENTDAGGVTYAVRTALELHQQREAWRRVQANGMARDWSWTRSAQQYVEIYRSLLVGIDGI